MGETGLGYIDLYFIKGVNAHDASAFLQFLVTRLKSVQFVGDDTGASGLEDSE